MQPEKKCCQKLEPLSLCNISNSGNASSYRMFSAQANWKIQKPPENNVFNEVVGERIISDFCVVCVIALSLKKGNRAVVKLIRDINAHAGSVATMHLHVSV